MAHTGHSVIARLIKKHGHSSCGGYTAHLHRLYLCLVCSGGGKSILVHCLSCCWRGPTWASFYKSLVPGAPAHISVGMTPRLCGSFYSALSKGGGGGCLRDHDLYNIHIATENCSQPETQTFLVFVLIKT